MLIVTPPYSLSTDQCDFSHYGLSTFMSFFLTSDYACSQLHYGCGALTTQHLSLVSMTLVLLLWSWCSSWTTFLTSHYGFSALFPKSLVFLFFFFFFSFFLSSAMPGVGSSRPQGKHPRTTRSHPLTSNPLVS